MPVAVAAVLKVFLAGEKPTRLLRCRWGMSAHIFYVCLCKPSAFDTLTRSLVVAWAWMARSHKDHFRNQHRVVMTTVCSVIDSCLGIAPCHAMWPLRDLLVSHCGLQSTAKPCCPANHAAAVHAPLLLLLLLLLQVLLPVYSSSCLVALVLHRRSSVVGRCVFRLHGLLPLLLRGYSKSLVLYRWGRLIAASFAFDTWLFQEVVLDASSARRYTCAKHIPECAKRVVQDLITVAEGVHDKAVGWQQPNNCNPAPQNTSGIFLSLHT